MEWPQLRSSPKSVPTQNLVDLHQREWYVHIHDCFWIWSWCTLFSECLITFWKLCIEPQGLQGLSLETMRSYPFPKLVIILKTPGKCQITILVNDILVFRIVINNY